MISLFGHTLDPDQGSAAFTWAITGLGLGLIASFVRTNFLDATDPQRAYRDAQALIRELIGLSGRLSSGLDPVALGGQIESAVRDELPVAALTVHIPRGEVLTPLVGDTGVGDPDLAISEELAQYCLATGNVRVVGHSFAFPLNSGGGVAAVVSGVLAPGLDPQAMDLPRRLSALDRKLSPATVRLDTAVLFLAFRDSATVEERRRLAREMHDGVAQEMASLGYFVDSLVEQEPQGSDRARQLRHAARAADDGRRRGTPVGPDAPHEHRRERLPRHGDRLAGPPPQREQRYPDPRHPRRVDHPPASRGRERAAADRPGGHDQRGPALRRAGDQRAVPGRSARPPRSWSRDDGRGLGTGRDDSHGLEIMRERATLIGADLDVTDSVPHGTTVTVRLSGIGVSMPEAMPEPDTLLA